MGRQPGIQARNAATDRSARAEAHAVLEPQARPSKLENGAQQSLGRSAWMIMCFFFSATAIAYMLEPLQTESGSISGASPGLLSLLWGTHLFMDILLGGSLCPVGHSARTHSLKQKKCWKHCLCEPLVLNESRM